jgi:hypothetical protein
MNRDHANGGVDRIAQPAAMHRRGLQLFNHGEQVADGAREFLALKAYARLRVLRPLTLIKISGPGLARLGATAEVVHGGKPYDAPQAWSKALKAHPAGVDGIAYTARHDDEELCYARFDGRSDPVAAIDRVTDLDQDWFWRIAEPYGVGIAPS